MPERKKPAARRPGRRTARDEEELETPSDADVEDEDTPARAARPVAVGAASSTSAPAEEAEEESEALSGGEEPGSAPGDIVAPADGHPVIERPADELLAGLAALVVAISVFLPWYGGATTLSGHVTGWASGTWGPVVFFFALAVVGIVVLRRVGIPVSFPLEHSLIIEGVGWLSVIGVLVKRLLPLHVNTGFTTLGLGSSRPIFVTLVAGLALAFAGGRTSSAAPFVIKPGWWNAPGGKTGVGILSVALILGLVFGFTNQAVPSANAKRLPAGPRFETGLPKCARTDGFPLPSGFRAIGGYEPVAQTGFACYFNATTKLTLARAEARYKAALTSAHWKFKSTPGANKGTPRFDLTSPQCGLLQFSPGVKTGSSPVTVTVTVLIRSCAPLKPTSSK